MAMANAMMHPSHEVEREYAACGRRKAKMWSATKSPIAFARGVALDDGPAKFDEIERIGGTDSHDWFRVLKEGRNREVRRLWESQGLPGQPLEAHSLWRQRIACRNRCCVGHSQELPQAEVDALRKAVGLEDGAPSALTLMPVLGQRKASKNGSHRQRPGPRPRGRP